MGNYLDLLNAKQYDAVTTTHQHVRVVAGAGSGKTRVLTSRLAFLIDSLNINPRRILAITFTNKAAKEMKTRVEKLLGVDGVPSIISTYHSFCARFLREEVSHIGYTKSFTIIDEEDQKKVIKDVKEKIDSNKLFKPDQLIGFISNVKTFEHINGDNLDPDSELGIKYRIYLAYEQFLKDNNYLDFDDLILKTEHILEHFPEIRKKWQDRFDYVLIDEFQDTNNQEYHLVKMLLREDAALYVVGDPDQTIYTWRGANLDIILNFTKDFKDVRDYILDINYRSTQEILDAANALIKNNKKRLSKDLMCNSKYGNQPYVFGAYTQEYEAEYIANSIYQLINEDPILNYSDIAIFYRSNWYSKSIEEQLIKLRIPYTIYGAVRFYERKEVKDALAYLRLICVDNDVLAFTRIINCPRRGVGEVTLNHIFLESEKQNISPFEYVKQKYQKTTGELGKFVDLIEEYRNKIEPENNPNFGDVLKELLNDSGYIYTIDQNDEEERLDNLRALENFLFDAQMKNPNISLKEILQDIALYSAQDEITDNNSVSLMTVHTAKGLEFPVVFVAGLAENVFPSRRACESERENDYAMEEERRLAYVAFTRAMKRLYLTYNTGFDFQTSGNKVQSRFLIESKDYLRFANNASTVSVNNRPFKKPVEEVKVPKKPVETRIKDFTSDTEFRPGMQVHHIAFGDGVVLNILEYAVEVAFFDPNVGVTKISKKFSGLTKKE